MLKRSDSRNFGRTLAGIGLIAGPILLLISTLVSPAWADDTAEYLDEVAANEGAHLASALIGLLGAFLLVAGLFGLFRLFRERRVNLGQIAVGLLLVGVIASIGFYVIAVLDLAMVDAEADRAEMVALTDRVEDTAGAVVLILLFLVGVIIGSLLLAFALWRRRVVPVWIPAVLLVSTILEFFAETQVVAAISFALLAVALGALGVKLLGMSDEEWDRWELPPRGSGAAGTPPEPRAAA